MQNILEIPYSVKVKAKLNTEQIDCKDRKGQVIAPYVKAVIIKFSEEDEKFAEAVYKTERSLSDVCYEIGKEIKDNHISDIEIYRSAVQNYFPEAEINVTMKIEIKGEIDEEQLKRKTEYPKVSELETPEFKLPEIKHKTKDELEEEARNRHIKEENDKINKYCEKTGQIYLFEL